MSPCGVIHNGIYWSWWSSILKILLQPLRSLIRHILFKIGKLGFHLLPSNTNHRSYLSSPSVRATSSQLLEYTLHGLSVAGPSSRIFDGMDDFTEMVLILSMALAFDLLLLTLCVLTTLFGPTPFTPEWKIMQTKAACFLCVCEFTAAICGAAYLRTLVLWVVYVCPRMSTLEDCNLAMKTWGNVCWWLILPIIFAASIIFSSCPRARTTLVHNPERLYFLTDHIVSIVMFQVSLYFSLPLAFPFLFFKNVSDDSNWIVVCLTCGAFMIMAYILGIAYGIEGSVNIWFQTRGRSPRPTIQEGEFILLTSISNSQRA